MTQPEIAPETAALVAALVENAQRLGLVWRLLPGTVTSSTSGPVIQPADKALVALDGDPLGTDPIPAVSLAGVLLPGERVMTMHVPPQGVYVIGRYGSAPLIPNCEIISQLNQPVNNASFATVEWDSANRDNAGFFQGANSINITLPYAGLYDFSFYSNLSTAASGGTAFLAIVSVAGVAIQQGGQLVPVVGGGHDTAMTLSDQAFAPNAGVNLSVSVYQVSGGTRSVNSRIRIKYAGLAVAASA